MPPKLSSSTVVTLIQPPLLLLSFGPGLAKLLLVSRCLVERSPILLCLGVLGRRLYAGGWTPTRIAESGIGQSMCALPAHASWNCLAAIAFVFQSFHPRSQIGDFSCCGIAGNFHLFPRGNPFLLGRCIMYTMSGRNQFPSSSERAPLRDLAY